ncbi:lytic transglycosylase domain-containing protein [Simonsiella muelleri]|uniref:Transglycosylase SLT domain-containing protein n=1 Tax=Simonsiella muelleri ATCC 29453 TaxID=641147 RepID=V9HKR5_9NEIS|nr:lytic transglycosylase domain-containing protein [Simonsiella muelleri]AUX61490.1 transglycosylase [Simonsiella muelleri ATCC 29453]EFG30709.1 hypothetical protein HMPREF9021_01315 [Simonsiella muelleri ATCC 29453]UBQ53544.1 lytic transglycosylase domain-containing protein [Simonsiella muelleri]
MTHSILTRRQLLLTTGAALAFPKIALAGAQREETLADDIASVMRSSIAHASPPQLVFAHSSDGQRWLNEMSVRLSQFIKGSELERRRLLTYIQYEATRADLDVQLILGLIEVESGFHQYAVSGVGAKGLMQVMPFWQKYIGKPEHNLFDVRTNLRYGCTILRQYKNLENSNIRNALARYNGSLGSDKYPNAVIGAWKNHWQWGG